MLQIGLIALAMIVTHSSISYLQAREGLPLGTKYVGWVTLGNCRLCQPKL
jgi:phosphatidylinositol glycan class N